MANTPTSLTLKQQIVTLQERLEEAESTLNAIRTGAVDALVVTGKNKQEVYTLKSADYAYRVLIESMNQGALTLSFDGTILYSNKQFSTMLQAPLENIIGDNILNFVSAKERPVVRDLLKPTSHTDIQIEICLYTASAVEITVMISAATVHKQTSKYLCVVVTDLTERKRAEDAKDEFISLASHQLRTPATSVKQYANMLIDGLFGEMKVGQLDALKKINMSNERELRIVDDLLKVAQIDAGKIVPKRSILNLNPLVEDIVSEQAVCIKRRKQNIKYVVPDNPVNAFADEDLFRMVIENLIDNASKYMPESRTITLRTKVDNRQAVFIISDQGVGMSENDISMLFKKFSRIPNSLSVKAGGSGLGLYWVKKVIDLHDGTIEVTSTAGKGTTFTVKLPQEG